MEAGVCSLQTRNGEPTVLLGFSISGDRGILGHLLNTQFGLGCCPLCEFAMIQGSFLSQI